LISRSVSQEMTGTVKISFKSFGTTETSE
jgi:hypothetical protein